MSISPPPFLTFSMGNGKLQLNIYYHIFSDIHCLLILHLRNRKDFAGKTKHKRTALNQKTIHILSWIYAIYRFLNCLSPEEKDKNSPQNIYILYIYVPLVIEAKPLNNGSGRVVSSSSTSLTNFQVNLPVIKSTSINLLPKEPGVAMKTSVSGFTPPQFWPGVAPAHAHGLTNAQRLLSKD